MDGTQATLYDYGLATVEVTNKDNINQTINAKEFTLSSPKGKIVQDRTFNEDNWTSNFGKLTMKLASPTTDMIISSFPIPYL